MATPVDNIKTKQTNENGEGIVKAAVPGLCGMCVKEESKYTCPRCNMGYCSLPCYQSEKHEGCSEAFYKDWVMDSLKDSSASQDDKKKVIELLMKDLEDRHDPEEDDEEEEEEVDLAERMKDLDLDKDIAVVWRRLTPKEKEQFARMLQDGRMAKIIEIWTPWWQRKENLKLVQEQQGDESCMEAIAVPNILPDIPDVNTLLKNLRPSSNCRFDVINILHAYAYIARLHNGCYIECPVDATQDLLEKCCVLGKAVQCGSVGEAVQAAQDSLAQNEKKTVHDKTSPKFNQSILKDVQQLLKGPGKKDSLLFVMAALSDLAKLCHAALAVIRNELKSKKKEKEEDADLQRLKSSVFKAHKKLVFLLSWCQRYGLSLHQLLPLLQFEIETREIDHDQVSELKSAVESHMDKLRPQSDNQEEGDKNDKDCAKALIQEIS